jgi:hypothetical protein
VDAPVAVGDRPQSTRPTSPLANSMWVWLVLVGFLVLVNLFITFVGAGLERDPRVGLFSWPAIAIFGVLGAVGLWFAHRTGFPAAWDPRVSTRQRFLYPALFGLGFGLLQVAVEQVTHSIQFFLVATGLPAFNAPFPGSLLFYTGGAIIVEVIYRLLPIPLLLWLISNVILRGRAQEQVFWVLALLSSAIEPLSQDLVGLRAGLPLLAVAQQVVTHYAFNLTQAVMFRRYGVLAAIIVRVAMYLVWHVGYGNFICRC